MGELVIKAAGIVMIREGQQGREVALIHRRRRNDWSLPKGKTDPGELLPVTATRETWEETGFHADLGMPLPMQRYLVDGIAKEVHYWVSTEFSGEFVENDEVDVLRWVPIDVAKSALTYTRDTEILTAAERAILTRPLIILRHATATKRAVWRNSGKPHADRDSQRPLSPEGFGQLHAISELLESYAVTSIVSSDAIRCRQTVMTYGEEVGVPITLDPRISEDGFEADQSGALNAGEELLTVDASLVVCSHRPVMETILRGIVGAAADCDPTDSNLDAVLPPAGALVLHRDANALTRIVAVERWLPATEN